MSSKLVERRLNDFQRRFGKNGDAALKLACYAAIPVALNPELLHFLRINFFFVPPEQLPYTVEFEFFTSGLCRAIDVELYEIEPEARNELLKRLMERKDAPQQIRDVATLLWQYVEHHSPWADKVELERSQQLTALHFLNPEKAQEWLNEANANNTQDGEGQEWFIAMRQEINQLSNIGLAGSIMLSLASTNIVVFIAYLSIKEVINWFRNKSVIKKADKDNIAFTLQSKLESGNYKTVQGIFNIRTNDIKDGRIIESEKIDSEVKDIHTNNELVIYE